MQTRPTTLLNGPWIPFRPLASFGLLPSSPPQLPGSFQLAPSIASFAPLFCASALSSLRCCAPASADLHSHFPFVSGELLAFQASCSECRSSRDWTLRIRPMAEQSNQGRLHFCLGGSHPTKPWKEWKGLSDIIKYIKPYKWNLRRSQLTERKDVSNK